MLEILDHMWWPTASEREKMRQVIEGEIKVDSENEGIDLEVGLERDNQEKDRD